MLLKKYVSIFLLVGVCSCEVAKQTESNLNETANAIILPALRERTDILFNKRTRDLNTLVLDSSSFNYIFPNTDISCGYLLRYYFYTNINLGKDSNELISMGGSIFRLDNFYNNHQEKHIINLSKQVITTIGDMYFGSSELKKFLSAYPNVNISD